jgi:hypothetical protein
MRMVVVIVRVRHAQSPGCTIRAESATVMRAAGPARFDRLEPVDAGNA